MALKQPSGSRRINSLAVAALLLLLAWLPPRNASGRVQLLDGSLELSGYLKEYTLIRTRLPDSEKMFRQSRLDFSQSALLIEGLYRIKNSRALTVNLFGGLRAWYEKAPALDSEIKQGIPPRARKDYLRPRDGEYVTEAYLDISGGPWQLIVGKQIVVWGETDIVRTADVINPLDLRYALPGIDFWEELKQGLWMLRGFYRTRMPGDLLLEFIFIPGDFQPAILPPEGTHWGPSPADTSPRPGRLFGYSHWLLEKMRRDAPGWSLKNFEWGVRLRGFTWDIDWTLIYFDTLSDTATANPARSRRFTLDYLKTVVRSMIPGSSDHSDFPGYRVFRYKRYRVLGGTAQAIVKPLHGSVWRLEWFYESGQHFNRARNGQMGGVAYDEVRRDAFGFGLNYSDKFKLPYLTHRWFGDKQLEVSLTLFREKIFNYDRDLVVDASRGHRIGDSRSSFLIWNIIQPIQYQIWTLILAGYYNPNGLYFLFPMVSCAPGNHWRWEAGLALFGDRSASARHPYRDKDSLLLRVRYEW